MLVVDSNPTLTHVTIANNTADYDGGGMILLNHSSPTLTNSIAWNNSPESIYLYFGDENPLITYSDVEGGWEGEGNIALPPLFTSPGSGDYSLQDTIWQLFYLTMY